MKITNKKACAPPFPNTAPWEDFLDLSRWRVPASYVVTQRRLVDNFALYSGNYMWIWFVLSSTFGLYLDWKVLVSFFVVAASWLCILEFHNGRLGGNSKKLDEDASPPPSVMVSSLGKTCVIGATHLSAGGRIARARYAHPPTPSLRLLQQWILPLAAFVFYALSVLPPVLLTGVGTLSVSCAHAAARPLANESLLIQQHRQANAVREQQVAEDGSAVQPDGFVDGREEEQEEVTFVQPKSAFAERQRGPGKPTRRAL